MAAITPQNGRTTFLASWDPHTYWELNSTNLGTNYGDDTSGNDDNGAVASGDISTSDSYEGMNSQNDPSANGWFDIYTVTDAAALVYIPSGLTTGNVYGLWSNGGGTNGQGGFLRATATGMEVALCHNTGGTDQDNLIYEIPAADLDGWHCIGWQFSSYGGTQGDCALWINGVDERSGTRAFQLAYGSGNPDFGANAADEPLQADCLDPPSYSGGNWGAASNINSSGILIANFCCDNPGQTNTTPAGNGDSFYTDYYDAHVVSSGASVTPSETSQAQSPDTVAVTYNAPLTVVEIGQVSPLSLQRRGRITPQFRPYEVYEPPASTGVTPTETSQAQASDTTSVTEAASVTPSETSQAQASDTVAVTSSGTLSPTETSQAQASDTIAVTEAASVTATETSQAQASDTTAVSPTAAPITSIVGSGPTISRRRGNVGRMLPGFRPYEVYEPPPSTDVTPTETSQAQASDTTAVTEAASVTATETSQAQASDTTTAVPNYAVTPTETNQAQASDTTAVTESGTASPTETSQAQASGTTSVVEHAAVAATETSQAQTSDTTSVSLSYSLTPTETSQAQASDTAGTTEAAVSTPVDSSQTQTSDNAVLSINGAVGLADTSQSQTSDAIVLSPNFSIALDDSTQAQTSEATALILDFPLTSPGTTQAQTSGTPSAIENPVVRAVDTRQLQTSDQGFAFEPGYLEPVASYQSQGSAAVDVTYYTQRQSVIRAIGGQWWVDVGRNINIGEDDL